ncbi:uncharacterized protein LOC141723981 isoform X1 [Apium graveolens]|uniref:uncharacterized protein LOC141723981 isoform X1 n=1 Tax=Apium graveolens TaxID=4045 RepID=UPI003D7B7451
MQPVRRRFTSLNPQTPPPWNTPPSLHKLRPRSPPPRLLSYLLHSSHTHTPPHTNTAPSCSYCVDPTSKTPYICPICINPSTPIFQDSKPIDLNAARVFLCAAKIVSALMSKAVVEARVKAERKAKAAIMSRNKARIAANVFDCVLAEAMIKEKLLDFNDSKCKQFGTGEKGDKLLLCNKCIRPLLGSVPRGSRFCAECSGQVRDILTPNQTGLPDMDMAVDKELLTEALLRNITPPLYERAIAGQSHKAEPIKKTEKMQSTTKRDSKLKLVGEPEGEVKFGATVAEEDEMTINEEDLDGVNVCRDRTEILLNGGYEDNEEGNVDPDALKKKDSKRRCSPSKEKVGGW